MFDINPSEFHYNSVQRITSFKTDRMGNSVGVFLHSYNYLALDSLGNSYVGAAQLPPNQWSTIEIDITRTTITLNVNGNRDIKVGYSSTLYSSYEKFEALVGGTINDDPNTLFKGAIKNIKIGSKPLPADENIPPKVPNNSDRSINNCCKIRSSPHCE
jgi:hypothetical protein